MVNEKPFLTGAEWDLVFLLPPIAFKLWMFHYRCEIDGRESFPGEDTILSMCGIDNRKTLFEHRKWLKKYGWLVQTSKAYRGHNPTFRVEKGWIPDRGCQMHETPKEGCVVCQENNRKRTEKRDALECVPANASPKTGRLCLGSIGLGSTGLDSVGLESSSLSSSTGQDNTEAKPTSASQRENQNQKLPEPEIQVIPAQPIAKPVPAKYGGKSCWKHHLPLPCPSCRDRSSAVPAPQVVAAPAPIPDPVELLDEPEAPVEPKPQGTPETNSEREFRLFCPSCKKARAYCRCSKPKPEVPEQPGYPEGQVIKLSEVPCKACGKLLFDCICPPPPEEQYITKRLAAVRNRNPGD